MSWTSLDEDECATSSSDAEDLIEPKSVLRQMNDLEDHMKFIGQEDEEESRDSTSHKDRGSEIQDFGYSSFPNCQGDLSPCNPFVQEPNSNNEINLRKEFPCEKRIQNILAMKDERIRYLQKLINGQREQLYHFLNVSLNEETLIEFKNTCRETEALNRNENVSMALDKFKYDNNIPTEQTLVRDNVSRTLTKIEGLVKRQMRLMKSMESEKPGKRSAETEVEKSTEISRFQRDEELTDVEQLLKSSKQIQRNMQMLKIQLKKLALIEQERIDLVERVYSMPSDQRQYYAHLAVIEREKIQLGFEVEKLNEHYRELKEKCCLLEETEIELNKCIDSKISGLDINKIKPGLETHLELMDMVERGELSLITLTKDEKGKLSDDFVKLYNENAEISERLKDFDKVMQERDDLKREIEVLVDTCHRLRSEVKALRLASKTDDLLEELRKACMEREQLKTKLERLTKAGAQGVSKIRDESTEKIREERDQLKLRLAECENIFKQLEHMEEVERQRENLFLEVSKYRFALLRQEEEIKDLVITIDKLIERVKFLRIKNPDVILNTAEGIPEGPEVNLILNSEEEKRVGMIRNRIRQDNNWKNFYAPEVLPCNAIVPANGTFIATVKSFLGLNKSRAKTFND